MSWPAGVALQPGGVIAGTPQKKSESAITLAVSAGSVSADARALDREFAGSTPRRPPHWRWTNLFCAATRWNRFADPLPVPLERGENAQSVRLVTGVTEEVGWLTIRTKGIRLSSDAPKSMSGTRAGAGSGAELAVY